MSGVVEIQDDLSETVGAHRQRRWTKVQTEYQQQHEVTVPTLPCLSASISSLIRFQSINQSMSQSVSRSIDRLIHRSIHPSIHQTINQKLFVEL